MILRQSTPVLVLVPILAGALHAAPRAPIDEVLLRRLGAEPTKESIGALLRRLAPSEEEHRAARRSAVMLGAKSAAGRDNAQNRLLRAPVAAAAALRDAVRSPDPEVRRRARLVYDRIVRAVPSDAIDAALRTIVRHRIRGLATEVLRAVGACFDPYGIHLAERAMFHTARKEDAALLYAGLRAADTSIRIVALAGLAALGGDPDALGLPRLLTDPDERVRAASAELGVRVGKREALSVLGALLAARDPRVRSRAARALRHVSGQVHGFDEFAAPGVRRDAVAKWTSWIRERGPAVKLDRAVPFTAPPRGRQLVAVLTPPKTLDEQDVGTNRQTWSYDTTADDPWIVTGYPDGSRLVALYEAQTIRLYDRHDRLVRSWRGVPAAPTSAVLLENGDLLATCGFMTENGVIVQLSPDDTILLRIEHKGNPMDAKPLPDGNLLVCLYDDPQPGRGQPSGRVVEMTRKGKIVRSIGGDVLKGPYSAHRLANGHTIVADMRAGMVVEFDKAGKRVRSVGGQPMLYCVQPQPNGTILFGAKTGVYEIGLDNKVKLLRKTRGYTWIHRY